MSRRPVLLKGDIVQCPRCEVEIAEITRDCYEHEILDETMFKSKSWPLKNGDECKCRECGEDWGRGGQAAGVHLKNHGWSDAIPF